MLIHSLQPPVQVAPVKSISKVVSPCIKICTLQDDFCIGCGRSTQEIAEWATATQKRREEIMTVVQWVVGVSLAFVGFVAVVYFAAKWAGKI